MYVLGKNVRLDDAGISTAPATHHQEGHASNNRDQGDDGQRIHLHQANLLCTSQAGGTLYIVRFDYASTERTKKWSRRFVNVNA